MYWSACSLAMHISMISWHTYIWTCPSFNGIAFSDGIVATE